MCRRFSNVGFAPRVARRVQRAAGMAAVLRGAGLARGRGGRLRYTPLSIRSPSESEAAMLWTIAVVLVVLWLLGIVSSYTLGGFIHLLLLLAIIAVAIRLIQGRPVL